MKKTFFFALCLVFWWACNTPQQSARNAENTADIETVIPLNEIPVRIPRGIISSDTPTIYWKKNKAWLDAYYNNEYINEWYKTRYYPPDFDFNMDISNKSYLELVLLRNEIYARNGFLFMNFALRSWFNQFQWYQPIFLDDFKVQLTTEEQAFVDKVLEKEKLLEKTERTTQSQSYKLINAAHTLNQILFDTLPQPFYNALATKNFAIVPARHEQLFYVYDVNQYSFIPNFITTDLYLQLLHKHFSKILETVETEKFIPLFSDLLFAMHKDVLSLSQKNDDKLVKAAADWATTYLAIASNLLTETKQAVPATMQRLYNDEIKAIHTAAGTFESVFLNKPFFDYANFTPRGTYTATPQTEQYFRCMKWLNTASVKINSDTMLLANIIMAYTIVNKPAYFDKYEKFRTTIEFIAGGEDNLSLHHIIQLLKQSYANKTIVELADKSVLQAIRKQLIVLNPSKINAKGITPNSQKELSNPNVLFTAGRYNFDGDILIRLVEVQKNPALRPYPKGLDVLAAMGNTQAEKILLDEYQEVKAWEDYDDSLRMVQKMFKNFSEWDKNIYNKRMQSILSILQPNADYPLFMQTPWWGKKNLNTSLAAWAQLKHEMLLYSERPMAAEAGEGGGPPPATHLSYVEPNIAFWQASIDLIQHQQKSLLASGMFTNSIAEINTELIKMAQNFLNISKKELKGEKLTTAEHDHLSWIGGEVERLTFQILQTDHLPEREQNIATVADVYAHNSSVLEVAGGNADEIYVVVDIDGQAYIARGAVFSYYEFIQGTPLNDEQWQKMLTNDKAPVRPIWLNDVMVKVKSPSIGKQYFSSY